MDNIERRARIASLLQIIDPLRSEKIRVALEASYFANAYQESQAEADKKRYDDATTRYQQIESELNPLLEALAPLQVKYGITYEATVYEHMSTSTQRYSEILLLSTYLKIDTSKGMPDFSDPDVLYLANELRDYFQMKFENVSVKLIKLL